MHVLLMLHKLRTINCRVHLRKALNEAHDVYTYVRVCDDQECR